MSGEILCINMVVRGFNSRLIKGFFELELRVKEESADPPKKPREARIEWEQELNNKNYLPPSIRIGERLQVYYDARDGKILRACNGNKVYVDCLTNEDLKHIPN